MSVEDAALTDVQLRCLRERGREPGVPRLDDVRREVDRLDCLDEAAPVLGEHCSEPERLLTELGGVLLTSEAEARGIKQVLEAKAHGYQALVQSANNDARAAATLLLTEKLEQIVTLQVEAIKAIKIDKVTVWDGGASANGGGTTTSNFLAGMVKSLPPLHDVAAMAGLDLPKYLGDAKAPELPASNGHG